jgi:serine/threonine protein kinase
MLEKNPAKRISAKECLKHPWIVANSKLEKTDFNPVSPYKTK